jgi:hypothetical protein
MDGVKLGAEGEEARGRPGAALGEMGCGGGETKGARGGRDGNGKRKEEASMGRGAVMSADDVYQADQGKIYEIQARQALI